jgi:hypothetical protein
MLGLNKKANEMPIHKRLEQYCKTHSPEFGEYVEEPVYGQNGNVEYKKRIYKPSEYEKAVDAMIDELEERALNDTLCPEDRLAMNERIYIKRKVIYSPTGKITKAVPSRAFVKSYSEIQQEKNLREREENAFITCFEFAVEKYSINAEEADKLTKAEKNDIVQIYRDCSSVNAEVVKKYKNCWHLIRLLNNFIDFNRSDVATVLDNVNQFDKRETDLFEDMVYYVNSINKEATSKGFDEYADIYWYVSVLPEVIKETKTKRENFYADKTIKDRDLSDINRNIIFQAMHNKYNLPIIAGN